MTTGIAVMGVFCVICLVMVLVKNFKIDDLTAKIVCQRWEIRNLARELKILRLLTRDQEAEADEECLKLWDVKKQGGE